MADGIVTLYQSGDMSGFRPPAEILAEAGQAASALQDVIAKTNAVVTLGNSKHLKAEAWQTLGHFYGLTARIRETKFVDYGGVRGFEAFAELVHTKTGNIVSTGEAMCLSDEERWSTRPKYEFRDNKRVQTGTEPVPLFQLRSMAQTRAISKVHSNALKWVVVLAGYNPTPAEEVDEDTGQITQTAESRPMPKRTPNGSHISEGQWKRLYAIGCGAIGKDELMKWLEQNQVDPAKKGEDITPQRYDALVAALENSKAGK